MIGLGKPCKCQALIDSVMCANLILTDTFLQVIAAFLMIVEGLDAATALDQLKRMSPRTNPNSGFRRQLKEFESLLKCGIFEGTVAALLKGDGLPSLILVNSISRCSVMPLLLFSVCLVLAGSQQIQISTWQVKFTIILELGRYLLIP